MLHLYNGQLALKCGIISVWNYGNLFLTSHMMQLLLMLNSGQDVVGRDRGLF